MRYLLVCAAAAMLGLVGPAAVRADTSDSTFVGMLAYAVENDTAKQLELSAEVKQKLVELIDRRESEAVSLAQEVKGLAPAEQRAKLAPFVAASEKEGLALLSETQRARLKQISLSRQGMQSLVDAQVARDLKLSDAQKEKVSELLAQQDKDFREGNEEQRRIARLVYERKLARVLTAEQKTAWDKLAGQPGGAAAEGDAAETKPGDAKPAAGASADATTPASKSGEEKPADSKPADAKTADSKSDPKSGDAKTADSKSGDSKPSDPKTTDSKTADTKPEGKPLDSKSGDIKPSDPRTASDSKTSGDRKSDSTGKKPDSPAKAPPLVTLKLDPAKGNGKLKFNFRYAPWKDVLDWFAQQADLSLVADAPPQGTFNYVDSREYTAAEAIDLINSVLLTKGYTLVRRERLLMLVNLQDGVPPTLVSRVPATDLDKRGEFELVSCLFTLEKMSPSDAEAEVKKLLGAQGSIVVLPKARQILVTETAGRLRTIREVIQAVESPASERSDPIRTFALEHAAVDDVMLLARQLMGIPDEKFALPDGSLRIAPDPVARRLVVTGKTEAIARFEQVIKLADVPGKAAPAVVETPQLEVYPVAVADPNSVLQVAQTLLAGMPDVRIALDPKTGNLIVNARPSQHATIKATLDQMQRDGKQFEVIVLKRVDPQLAVISINKLFGGDDEGKGGNGPKVESDPTTHQLLIRGTTAQIEQIRQLLTKMGEGEGSDLAGGAAGERSNIRFVPLTGPNADAILDQAQTAWTVGHVNKVRIVPRNELAPGARPGERFPGGERPRPSAETAPRSDLDFIPREFLPLIPLPGEKSSPSPAPSQDKKATPPAPIAPPATVPSKAAPPAENKPAPPPVKESKTAVQSGHLRAMFVAAPLSLAQAPAPLPAIKPAADKPGSDKAPADKVPGKAEGDTKSSVQGPAAFKLQSVAGAEIVVSPGPGGVLIASQDLEALDAFESLVASLSERSLKGASKYTVFYLKYAKAEVAGALLQEIMSGGSGSESGGGSGGSLLGDLASAAIGGEGGGGGGLLGSLLGLGGGGGGSKVQSTGTVSIVSDHRLNALVVQANAKDLDTIEQLLKVIDQETSPEDVQTIAKPKLIPVLYTSADEIAEVVRQVYAQRVQSSNAQPRQPSPDEFLRALRGGRGGGARGGSDKSKQDEPLTFSIGVDKRSNSLIVSAAEPLFLEIKALVEQLDRAGSQQDETMRVVSLKSASPELLQKALVSIGGDKIRSTTARMSPSPNLAGSTSRTTSDSSARPAVDDQRQAEIRRQFEIYNALQQSGLPINISGQPGGQPGGGFQPGGFQPGGGFPGGRGGQGGDTQGGRGGGRFGRGGG